MRSKKLILGIVTALLIAAVVFFIYKYIVKIGRILSPFLITIVLVYIVKPLSDRLTAKKIPVGLSILLVYLFIIAALAAIGIYIVPELAANTRDLMETLPQLMASYETMFNDIMAAIDSSSWSDQVKTAVFGQISNATAQLQDFLVRALEKGLKFIVEMARVIVDVTVAMVIAYYTIKDGEKFKNYFLSLFPKRWRTWLTGTGKEISKIIAGFIQGQLLIALIVAMLETIGLMLIGMRYPLTLGLIGGLANIIPYFGPYIGVVPATAVALTVSPMKAVWTILVFIIVQQIDNNFISPKMIEGRLGLHPVATIFAVLAGGEFFGIPGMLFAVPAMAVMRVLFNKAVEAIV